MRNLPVAHVKGAHEGPEVAPGVGCQVAHQSAALVATVRGFMRLSDEPEEPQASSSGRQTETFVGGGDHDEHRENRCGDHHAHRSDDGVGFHDRGGGFVKTTPGAASSLAMGCSMRTSTTSTDGAR